MDRTGVLLINTGTPAAPRRRAVRRYLRRFLSDPRVMDLNPVGRWLLLHLVILPRRAWRSAEAYRRIWQPAGSPLLVHTQALAHALAQRLGDQFHVVSAMRYGPPTVAEAIGILDRWKASRVIVFPLYPQYASATTGSAVEEAFRVLAGCRTVPAASLVPPFYGDPGLIRAYAAVGQPVLEALRPEHVLFSFHGLPRRQIRRADPTGSYCLLTDDCCKAITAANRHCYRAQCFETARLIAAALGLGGDRWSVSFQSRLGRAKWIEPYTDQHVRRLVGQGVRRLAVFCPSFVADCLETLEEVGLRLRDQFLACGGEQFRLVPSLNCEPAWVETAERLVRQAAGLTDQAVAADACPTQHEAAAGGSTQG